MGSPAGEARSPVRREGQDLAAHRHLHVGHPFAGGTQACSLGGPRLETQTGRARSSPPLLSPVSFFEILGSLEAALLRERAQGSVCSHAPLEVPWLLRIPGLTLVPVLGVSLPRPPFNVPFNAQQRWPSKMARLCVCCVQGPPALPRGSCPRI